MNIHPISVIFIIPNPIIQYPFKDGAVYRKFRLQVLNPQSAYNE